MIAADPDRAKLAQAVHDAIRVRPVPDDVAEVPDGIDRTGMGEHGVEGDEVAVDVGDDRDPHGRSG